jgi:phosphoribosylanthranilate isomerase
MTRFKICGIRDVDNALVAAESGADFLGFNFVHRVRRQLTLDQGQTIIQLVIGELGDDRPKLVGLFANQEIDEVNEIIERCDLNYAQLCGDEEPRYWDKVRAEVIKQIRVEPLESSEETTAATLASVGEVTTHGRRALLDSYKKGALGGTGHTFDWNIAERVGQDHEIILAGGLTPDNVTQAIRQVHPWMVDVSSGVETDGVKDPTKIRAFADEVRFESLAMGTG